MLVDLRLRKLSALAAPVLLAAVALVLGLAGASPAAASASRESSVVVYFTRGEHFTTARRDAAGRDPLEAALAALAAGPTQDERARGFRTSVPRGTAFLGVEVRDRVAVVNLSAAFARGGGAVSVNGRLAQLVFTATEFAHVNGVRLALDGKLVDEIRRVAVDRPLRRPDFDPPPVGGQAAPAPPEGKPSAALRRAQLRLIELGYLPAGAASGLLDERTRHATLAFQSWEGLARDGIPGPVTRGRLAEARRPAAAAGAGRRIEVSLRRQVALLVEGWRVVRIVHVSTGASASPTPRGSYRIFRKELRSWSIPFRQWLPYASYFTGGIAFHEYPHVPAYPASHGCVRVPAHDAPLVYRFARMGTRVIVA